MVVDGHIGFIGGVNISSVYGGGSAPGPAQGRGMTGWRDLHLQVEGPVVHRMQRLFVGHWQQQSQSALQHARYFPPQPVVGTDRVAVAATRSGPAPQPVLPRLCSAHSRHHAAACD